MNEDEIIQIIAKKWIDVMDYKKGLTKKDKTLIMDFAKDCDDFINGGETTDEN